MYVNKQLLGQVLTNEGLQKYCCVKFMLFLEDASCPLRMLAVYIYAEMYDQ